MSRFLAKVAAAAVALASTSAMAAIYNGNGNTGFGGSVGNGVLTVTDNGTDVTFSSSNAIGGNVLVIYIDKVAGGANDTSGYTDNSDGGRRAISGLSGDASTRTTATFASGFGADYALDIADGFAALFQPSVGGSHTFVAGATASGSVPRVVTVPWSALGGVGDFNFVGTLISETAFRSSEAYGTLNPNPAGNPGFTGNITFANSLAYVVPEPTSAALLGLGVLGLVRRRRA